ncbi:MAG: D-2-hydroxyacid dehydrogenase [Gammaproteobacteria bacterium]|nr:D-2-hydroxyacid dehydrogenase [Gammaproteobacteria bacterium]NIR83955.1 D-2-hydroxyacid dehydrogenase [Gammaproteobacteria bacterium]NIR88998.1 D-2-hydroxyacid dehydrogenase [Gammaproteobacteria bacterium]NIV74551.1 D-2-hydroxyacid dehydrogenase [Gammaproteobacteria bacterium]
MHPKSIVVITGARDASEIPGLEEIAGEAEVRFPQDQSALRAALRGADVLLGWSFRDASLREAWEDAGALRWIHWGGAGVDAVLLPELAESDVVLTNSRGVFDRSMAEYVLGLVLAFAKDLPRTLDAQRRGEWDYRCTERIHGRTVLVFGVGSVGREIARMLRAAGMRVLGVGRRARTGDPDFGEVHAASGLDALLGDADYVVAAAPHTSETAGLFDAQRFAAMRPSARFINVGRGTLVDETALVTALETGAIAGGALDVFRTEPLPQDSALWRAPNLIVSPHMSGDYKDHHRALARIFIDNFRRYRRGEPLLNVVDKRAGYVSVT